MTTIEQPQQPASPADMSYDEMIRRAEAALFDRSAASPGPKSPENGESDVSSEASSPKRDAASESSAPAADDGAAPRRILENLNEIDPLKALLAERAQTSRRGRKPGSKNKPKDAAPEKLDAATIANLKGRMELTPERITEALKAMERVSAAASARGAKPAPVPATVRHIIEVMQAEDGAEDGAYEDLAVVVRAATPDLATAADDVSAPVVQARPREKPSIRGRYVRGSELKPGERWKRRLRGPR